MKRKVRFADKCLYISNFPSVSFLNARSQPAMQHDHATVEKKDSLNQPPDIITDQTARNLHHRKRTIPGFQDMRCTQDGRIELLQLRAQLVRLRRLHVRRQRGAVRDAGRTQSQHGGDLVGRGIELPDQAAEIGDPAGLPGLVGRVVREGCGRVGDEGKVVQDVLDLGDEGVVGFPGEAATEGGFPGREGGVLF